MFPNDLDIIDIVNFSRSSMFIDEKESESIFAFYNELTQPSGRSRLNECNEVWIDPRIPAVDVLI